MSKNDSVNADRPNLKDGQTEADAAAQREVQNAPAAKKDDATVTRYFTKDGVPVEPSSIPAEQPFGPTPDASKRPDVVEKEVPLNDEGQIASKDDKEDKDRK